MTFGKLIDGNLTKFKNPIKTEQGDIFTNDEAVIRAHGYKEVVYTACPEVPEGYYAAYSWTENTTTITQVWTVVPVTPEDGEE